MKPNEFTTMLREWRARSGWSDGRAAMELGVPYATLRHWLAGRTVPGYFAMCAVVRQMREGHDPLSDVQMTPAEFAGALREWRAEHGFSRPQAGAALGTSGHVIRGWESKGEVPRQPALGEILRRLRMPVDAEMVKQATKRPRPIEPQKFAELLMAWRRRNKLNRPAAAFALRSQGMKTTARTIWVWEAAREYPQRPLKVLELIHGPIAVNPPRPKRKSDIDPRQFAAALRRWRKGHRLTQRQACAELGLPDDQALICDYELGNAVPRPDRARAIMAVIAARPAPPPPPRIMPSPFARGLRKWRKVRGLTLAEAAPLLGCSLGQLCRYELGCSEPPADLRAAIVAIIED